MRNVIVLGCGRSGTSLTAGLFSKAGYFMGPRLHLPDPSNPKGFFESAEINQLNEALIAGAISPFSRLLDVVRSRKKFLKNKNFWLAQIPLKMKIPATAGLIQKMQGLTAKRPYCFKDPRFCYTLPVWRPHLSVDFIFLCVFREPWKTAQSIVQECRKREHLRWLGMDFKRALAIWRSCYAHVLKTHRYEGQWMFVHYEQLFEETTLERLGCLTGSRLDSQFPDVALRKRVNAIPISKKERLLYHELCELAGYIQ